jgi:hypothetical protein
MAIIITTTGSEISTEKFVATATSDDPAVTSVILRVHIDGVQTDHTLENLPDFGTTDTFSFEINSIIKDYFDFQFLALTGANQTTTQNVLVGIEFLEVIGTAVGGASFRDFVVTKNMTQDTFEIEYFDLANYDCGDAGSATSKLLTSAPNPLPVGDLTSVFTSCLTTSYDGGLLPKQEWVIETYLNGVLVVATTEAVTVPTRGISGYITDGKYDVSNYRFDFDSSTGIDEVRIYIRDIASPFTTRSETRSYKLNDACERAITLSWYNELGAQDTFTFLGNINRVGKYTDSSFKKVRPVNPLSTNVGDLVYKSSYNYQYDIFSDRMPQKDVEWLSKILINKRAAIQSISSTSKLSFSGDNYLGSMPEDFSYAQFVDAGNGFAYAAPARSGNFLKLNLTTKALTTVTSAFPSGVAPYYNFGVLSNVNNKIYFLPADFGVVSDVLVFDPSLETYTTFGLGTLLNGVARPVITSGGVIYAREQGSSDFVKIDTNTNVITILNSVVSGSGSQAILGGNGFVYFVSNSATSEFHKIQISNDNITTIPAPLSSGYAISSGSLAPNGFIYCNMHKFNENFIFKIDTSNDVSSIINTGNTVDNAWFDTFIMQNGNVYFLGSFDNEILEVDTSNDSLSVVANITITAGSEFTYITAIGDKAYSIGTFNNSPVLELDFQSSSTGGKYFPILITTEETVLDDKFNPETLFRLKFRLANRRKGLK